MAHEVLAAKLQELDESLKLLRSRIHICESESSEQLQQEIYALQSECLQASAALQDSLKHSKAASVAVLASAYQQIEHIVLSTMQTLQTQEPEDKILLAEYALDFSTQASNHALLCALEAIAAQKNSANQERSSS